MAKHSKRPAATKEERVYVRVSASEKSAWEAQATADGRAVSGWLRYIANREAQATRQ